MANGGTRQKILNTSIDLIREYGIAKASMRDIARSGGITLSVFYNHFKDKHDLLFTILMRIGSDLEKELEIAEKRSDPGIDTIYNYIISQMRLIKDRPKEIKIYLEDLHLLPEPNRSIVLSLHRSIYNRYFRQVELIEKEGLLQATDKTVITANILAIVNWACRWFNDDGRLSMEEVARNTIKFCLYGILAKPAEK